jgi:MFS family permease
VLLAPFAGVAADRWDRRRIMVMCDAGRALALGSIPLMAWLGALTLWQIVVAAAIEGALNVFFDPAETAALPRIVGRDRLASAMAQNSATYSICSLVGQPLGGLFFQLGRSIPFLADAISYTASVVSLLFIRTEFQAERVDTSLRLRDQIRQGFAWIWAEPLIRFLAFYNGAFWVVYSGNVLLIIVIARHQHASPAAIGLVTAAIGSGGILGAILVPWIRGRVRFGWTVVGGMAILGLIWSLYAVAPTPVALAAVAFVGSAVMSTYNTVQMAYRMVLIPDALQGRVNSLFRLIAFSGQPVSLLLTGFLLETVGSTTTVVVGAAWFLLLAGVAALSTPVRHAEVLSAGGTR